MIKKLAFYDFDSTLVDSPMPETGKEQWSQHYDIPYPHIGWWGRAESLDLNVFDIKIYENIVSLARKDIQDSNTRTYVLTSRMEKLRPQLEAVLSSIGLHFDEVILKKDNRSKGVVVLHEIAKHPDVIRVDVYDDNYEREIISYKSIIGDIPEGVQFNIFHVSDGKLNLIKERYNVQNIIQEEIERFVYELKR
ncbi:MAG: hypothetical protein ACOC22_03160 [bacterium]